jgi:hypothetical protein
MWRVYGNEISEFSVNIERRCYCWRDLDKLMHQSSLLAALSQMWSEAVECNPKD